MSTGDLPLTNPAGLALARILRLALPDKERCKRAIRDALLSAHRSALPTDGEELLALVRAHLAPQLSEDVSPNLVFALIDDLKAEIEQQRAGMDPSSSSRLRAATCIPPSGLNAGDDAAEGADRTADGVLSLLTAGTSTTPFPKLRRSVSNLQRSTGNHRNSSAEHPTPIVPVPEGDTPGLVGVVVVETDRMTRASLGRALVGAGFDVSVLDTPHEVRAWLRAREASVSVIVIVDVAQDGIASELRSLALEHPALSVVAWTDAEPTFAIDLVARAGVRRCRVVAKSGSPIDVVSAVRALGPVSAKRSD